MIFYQQPKCILKSFFYCATSIFIIILHASAAFAANHFCPPLPDPEGTIVTITPSQVDSLQSIVAGASSGTTILLADGHYMLNGAYLQITADNVTIRGASGNREAVILDGGYVSAEIIQVVASNVTVADLTLQQAIYHPIHVTSTDSEDILNTLIYNVHIIDPGQQGIKINPAESQTHFADDGEIACSRIELTDSGRPHVWAINGSCYTGGIDAHQARNWTVRDNEIEGFWCENDISEHGIHFWRGSRDTTIIRNQLKDNVRGIGFGLSSSSTGSRTYSDAPCPGVTGYVGHYGGQILNNFIFQTREELRTSEYGFDSGVALAQSCQAEVIHNTIVSTSLPFSSIEYRFANTSVDITNNLVSHSILLRSDANAALDGNVTGVALDLFADPVNGDLHLLEAAAAELEDGVDPGLGDYGDIDGQSRRLPPDVGADEYYNCSTTLHDVIATLLVITGLPLETDPNCLSERLDRDDDGQLGLADAIAMMREIAL